MDSEKIFPANRFDLKFVVNYMARLSVFKFGKDDLVFGLVSKVATDHIVFTQLPRATINYIGMIRENLDAYPISSIMPFQIDKCAYGERGIQIVAKPFVHEIRIEKCCVGEKSENLVFKFPENIKLNPNAEKLFKIFDFTFEKLKKNLSINVENSCISIEDDGVNLKFTKISPSKVYADIDYGSVVSKIYLRAVKLQELVETLKYIDEKDFEFTLSNVRRKK